MNACDSAAGFFPDTVKLDGETGRLPLEKLDWPLGMPDRLRNKTIADLGKNDHLVVPPGNRSYFQLGFQTKAKISVFFLEPRAYHGKHVRLLRMFHWRFHKVFSAIEDDLVNKIPNGVLFPFGSTWVAEDVAKDVEKTRLISIVASDKRFLAGHHLRHDLIEWIRANNIDVEILGRGYAPFEHKEDGLLPYKFSMVIENAEEPNYFTEKLIDSLLCETVPIYWGCPNIERFIDPSCIVQCHSLDELKQAILDASDTLYTQMRPALLAAKERAAFFGQCTERIARNLIHGDAAF